MARLTKKSYKRKRIAIGLTLFASIALVSTGFAAWIVSSTANATGNGSVSMGQITDAALAITVNNSENLGKFSFGPLANDDRGIVKYDDNEHDTTLMIFRSDYFVQIRDFVRMSEDIIMGLYYNPDERTYLEQGLYERLLEKCETEKAKKAIETVYKFLIEKKEE